MTEEKGLITLSAKAQEVVTQLHLKQEIYEKVMQKDTHFGVIPGCPKPSLYKPGAEILGVTFGLSGEYSEPRIDNLRDGHREVIVTCKIVKNGLVLAMCSGSCSTLEGKYRWRDAQRKCPSCGKPTIIKGKEEYGGGWVCFAKKGGCGAKFADGDKAIEGQEAGRIENPDVADQYNTVLKMAQKRAYVGAMLSATAASDIFTQDVEDLPQERITPNAPKADSAPRAPSAPEKKPESPKRPEQPKVDPAKLATRQAMESGQSYQYDYAKLKKEISNADAWREQREKATVAGCILSGDVLHCAAPMKDLIHYLLVDPFAQAPAKEEPQDPQASGNLSTAECDAVLGGDDIPFGDEPRAQLTNAQAMDKLRNMGARAKATANAHN